MELTMFIAALSKKTYLLDAVHVTDLSLHKHKPLVSC
jgi:hypothetical protein